MNSFVKLTDLPAPTCDQIAHGLTCILRPSRAALLCGDEIVAYSPTANMAVLTEKGMHLVQTPEWATGRKKDLAEQLQQPCSIGRYRGRPVKELTKEELIEALRVVVACYEDRLATKDKIISLLEHRT